jgi:CcmD family protein
MEQWEYVSLAYGIVWSAICLYLFTLKGRLRRAELELAMARDGNDVDNEQK